MTQIFKLVCTKCDHVHPASTLIFEPEHQLEVRPNTLYTCRNCGCTQRVVTAKNQDNLIYQFVPVDEATYEVWTLWYPSLQHDCTALVSTMTIVGSPTVFEPSAYDVEDLLRELDSYRAQLEASSPWYNWSNTISVTFEELSVQQAAKQYGTHIAVPLNAFKDRLEASRFLTTVGVIAKEFLAYAHTATLYERHVEGETWYHNTYTAMVIDYLLRNTWFAVTLDHYINVVNGFDTIRPVVAYADGDVYFNTSFHLDVEPTWVGLYAEGYRQMSLTEVKAIVMQNDPVSTHAANAERYSPDRKVAQLTHVRKQQPVEEPLPTVKDTPTKRILH